MLCTDRWQLYAYQCEICVLEEFVLTDCEHSIDRHWSCEQEQSSQRGNQQNTPGRIDGSLGTWWQRV